MDRDRRDAYEHDQNEEEKAVRRVRRERERALSPSERVERLHALCAQMSVFTEAARRGAS